MLKGKIIGKSSKKVELDFDCRSGKSIKGGFVMDKPLIHESTIAFVCKSSMEKREYPTEVSPISTPPSSDCDPLENSEKNRSIIKGRVVQKPTQIVVNEQTTIEVNQKLKEIVVTESEKTEKEKYVPSVKTLPQSISKVSNLIKDWLHSEDVFNTVKGDIRDKKMYAETFYLKVQNAIYHSLREFCNVTKDDNNMDVRPIVNETMRSYSSLIFFDRMFNDNSISYEKNPSKVMEKYRKLFKDADGIQPEWIALFKPKMKSKINVESICVDKVADIILKEWCSRIIDEVEASDIFENVPSTTFDVDSETAKSVDELVEFVVEDNLIADEDGLTDDEIDTYLKASIIRCGKEDIVKIESSDIDGKVVIPFYVNIDKLPKGETIPSMADDRNGKWDWLIHFAPDLIFKTKNPDRYLAVNDNVDDFDENIKFVIMDENDGIYIIGAFCNVAIYMITENAAFEDYSDDTIGIINHLVNTEIATGYLSNLSTSLDNSESFVSEEFILENISRDDIAATIDSDVTILEPAMEREMDDITRAAIESLNENINDISRDDEIDTSVISINGKQFDEEREDFTFKPMRRNKQIEREMER